MEKEPKELIEARNLLSKFEKDMNQPHSIVLLGDALSNLEEIIVAVASQGFRNRATNIRKTYAHNIFIQAQKILSTADILEYKVIKHWSDMMALFGDIISEEFNVKSQVNSPPLGPR
jgi:hypothetical protein